MRKKAFQLGKSSPPWMLTYSDIVTQVLVFFILLFSLSDINIVKFSSYFRKMKKPPVILDEEQLRRVMLELADYAKEKNLESMIGMEILEQGLIISLTESLMFHSGEARILPEALPVLEVICEKLKYLPNNIAIEGHTDNIPIRTKDFPSNWELSVARAVNVLKYLIEKQGIDPQRVSASGYGEYRPVAGNDTDEGRAKNRRVVLVVQRQRLRGFDKE
ncbi:MAG: flagellar motor protein MotB [Candidatus Omnitrophica bacterium]|nr:flagellar motor protein MotB [Candidatus Omnitrophota bacterium]MCM8826393.1 flagellar motor protein MotB [Candidatus Omnitrophota bacterium]